MNTVCFILKAPRLGTVKTRLAREVGDIKALEIYRALVERQALELPLGWSVVVYFTPMDSLEEMRHWLGPILQSTARFEPQCDGDLGARLADVVQNELAQGMTRIFLIGGDCPALTSQYLQDAEQLLNTNDLAIGPALDGGYVLLGLKGFHRAVFEKIDWSTDVVLRQTIVAAEQNALTIGLLPTLEDVDDLQSYQRSLPSKTWE